MLTWELFIAYSKLQSNSKVIAVAATIITDAATKQTEKSNTLCMVSIFPLACYFDTFPNIRAMVDESVADVLTSYGFVQNKIFLFAPLAVSSFDIHAMYELGPDLEGGQFSELLILCKKHTAKALYTAVRFIVFLILFVIFSAFSFHFLQSFAGKSIERCI